jgi:hypothetical protein
VANALMATLGLRQDLDLNAEALRLEGEPQVLSDHAYCLAPSPSRRPKDTP